MLTAAALCPAPPLLARELTGTDPVLPELREACREAVAALLTHEPALVAIIGVSAETREWHGDARLDLGAYAPGLRLRGTAARLASSVPAAGRGAAAGLPLSVGLGARLLDQAGFDGPRILQSVSQAEPARACAALGGQLAAAADRVALLVMADGGARRGLKAPGYLDERCEPFDAGVLAAITTGDLATLLALDEELARDLMATGRPAWQVLRRRDDRAAASMHGPLPR